MSQKRIEKQFQDKLGDYASVIDEDQLWSNIEGRVPQKKKKKRFFFWFVFGLPVFAIVVVGSWFFVENGTEPAKASSQNNLLENIILEKQTDVNTARISEHKAEESISEEGTLFKGNSIASNNQKTSSKIHTNTKSIVFVNPDVESSVSKEIESSSSVSTSFETEVKSIDAIGNSRVSDRMVDASLAIPTLVFFPIIDEVKEVKLPRRKSRRPKRSKSIKPDKRPRPFVGMNYYAGKYIAKENLSGQDDRYVDFGEAYLSQGLSVSYNQFLTSKLYGRVIFNADQSYKKYTDKVIRDTIVPSSLGTQTLSSSQYQNGVIDTESGIPEVNGVFNRDVISNNAISSLSVGLGLGYIFPVGNLNLNLEADFQRTIYYDLSGLGRDPLSQNIEKLTSFDNYFSYDPKYSINSQVNVDYSLGKSLFLTAGVQYQMGINSILIEQTNHTEKIHLIRGSIGLKMTL